MCASRGYASNRFGEKQRKAGDPTAKSLATIEMAQAACRQQTGSNRRRLERAQDNSELLP